MSGEPEEAPRRPLVVVGPFHPLRGGIAHFDARLARELARRGPVHAVSFRRQYPSCLFPGRTQLDPSPAPAGVPPAERLIDSIGPTSWLSASAGIARLAPRAVVFAYWTPFMAPAYGTMARRLGGHRGGRRIVLCHNLTPHEAGLADRLLSRYLLRAVDGVLALSRAIEREVRAAAPRLDVEYSPHPVVDAFGEHAAPARPDARSALGLPNDVPVLLFFGYVRRYKGLDLAIEALARLRRAGRSAHLLVAGEFYEDRAPYDDMVRRLGLGSAVTVLEGYLPDAEVPRLFAAADACLLPYRSGSQSGVAKVAWRYGVPVVAAATGGLAEDVDDGCTGFLFRSGDAADLARAIERYLEAREGCDLGGRIRREQERFGWAPLLAALDRLAGTAR